MGACLCLNPRFNIELIPLESTPRQQYCHKAEVDLSSSCSAADSHDGNPRWMSLGSCRHRLIQSFSGSLRWTGQINLSTRIQAGQNSIWIHLYKSSLNPYEFPMIFGWFPWDWPAASKALTSCEMGSQAVQALLLLKHLDAMQAPGRGGMASVVNGWWMVGLGWPFFIFSIFLESWKTECQWVRFLLMRWGEG